MASRQDGVTQLYDLPQGGEPERLPQPEKTKDKDNVLLDERGLLDLPFLALTVLLVLIGVIMVFFAATAYIYGRTTLALLPATVAGGLAAFLCYNFHPAKVFMGDTGSLFLGGMVCGMAFALDMPLILILVGIIYICETLSVILQVTYFKLTHGKRIFKMTPIHHHFELCGWKEEKIVFVFTAITLVMCVLAYLGVMNRY